MPTYADSLDHILAELERIDLLLQVRLSQVRREQGADERFLGLAISDAEVDRLLGRPLGTPSWAQQKNSEEERSHLAALEQMKEQVTGLARETWQSGTDLRLPRLAKAFELTHFDVDCILLCLAPELDSRYERIFGYLQDDVTRRRPGIELALYLLTDSFRDKVEQAQRLADDAPLLRYRLLDIQEETSGVRGSWLRRSLRLQDRVRDFLLGSNLPDSQLLAFTTIVFPTEEPSLDVTASDMLERIQRYTDVTGQEQCCVYLQGPYGSGVDDLVQAFCARRCLPMLTVNLDKLLTLSDSNLPATLRLLHREVLLQNAVLFLKNLEVALDDSHLAIRTLLLETLGQIPGCTFVAGDRPWMPGGSESFHLVRLEIDVPSLAQREECWSRALAAFSPAEGEIDVPDLASKFRFTGGQIENAIRTARRLSLFHRGPQARLATADLLEACRVHSNQQLNRTAQKITPKFGWSDIVLPSDRIAQLREICSQVKYRRLVFEHWGFEEKLSRGKGLTVLFSGPSGTGKTMAAEILGSELGLDVYTIDLSTVISKYIGETEKNLYRIFQEAETSNAILFFDEADALFGKRSDVKDSHDRYANIEVAYLLQRMEQYSGLAILATNLRRNMDEAFVRRLQFSIDFPFPDKESRKGIWNAVWPRPLPLGSDLNFDLLAAQFELTGGNIRNIALASAFLAAANGGCVTTGHVLHAVRREYQKMGKILAEAEFTARAFLGQ